MLNLILRFSTKNMQIKKITYQIHNQNSKKPPSFSRISFCLCVFVIPLFFFFHNILNINYFPSNPMRSNETEETRTGGRKVSPSTLHVNQQISRFAAMHGVCSIATKCVPSLFRVCRVSFLLQK